MQAILNNDINEFKKNYNAAIITPKTIITIIKNGQIDFLKYLNTRGNLYCNCLIYAAKYNDIVFFLTVKK